MASEAILSARGVVKRFGGLVAVGGVDLEVLPGELVGLIGPNGAGKTTLFNVLAGATQPDEGELTFDGQSVTRLGAAAMCELGLTRTFQNPRPFGKLTVFENAMVGGMARGSSVAKARVHAREALELVGLWHRQADPAEVLPLGQLKRLEVARALATQPRMILLDEPIGGLNPAEIDEMATFISRLPEQGLSVLLIEHNMRVALSTCHRLLVLNFGKLIASGSGAEISQNPEVIRAYLGDMTDDELGLVRGDA